MFHASTEKDGRGTHKARVGDLVTSPNPYSSPSPNAICCIYSSCADKRGHYHSKCVVEQILVLGLKKQPSSVTSHSPGEETGHLFL